MTTSGAADQRGEQPTPAQREFAKDFDLSVQDAMIVDLKHTGLTYQQIGNRLQISRAAAFRGYERAIRRVPARAVNEYREEMYARIGAAREAVMDVLNARHVTVSNGVIVRDDEGPLEDDGVVLAAVDRLLKLDDQEAKLRGAYPKTEVNLTGAVRYEVVGLAGEELT
jgi:hypothetical protein